MPDLQCLLDIADSQRDETWWAGLVTFEVMDSQMRMRRPPKQVLPGAQVIVTHYAYFATLGLRMRLLCGELFHVSAKATSSQNLLKRVMDSCRFGGYPSYLGRVLRTLNRGAREVSA